jgi:hypothetical protein
MAKSGVKKTKTVITKKDKPLENVNPDPKKISAPKKASSFIRIRYYDILASKKIFLLSLGWLEYILFPFGFIFSKI